MLTEKQKAHLVMLGYFTPAIYASPRDHMKRSFEIIEAFKGFKVEFFKHRIANNELLRFRINDNTVLTIKTSLIVHIYERDSADVEIERIVAMLNANIQEECK